MTAGHPERYTSPVMSPRTISTIVTLTLLFSVSRRPFSRADDPTLHLTLRTATRPRTEKPVERPADWEAKKTAVILIDFWDKHWCDRANRRVAEMAPRMSSFVDALRTAACSSSTPPATR